MERARVRGDARELKKKERKASDERKRKLREEEPELDRRYTAAK